MKSSDALEIIWHELQQNEVPHSDALKLAMETLENTYGEATKGHAVLSNSTDLLCCPDCGADPKEYCVINSYEARELGDKNWAKAECKQCGFVVSISTKGSRVVIRKLWNTRAI